MDKNKIYILFFVLLSIFSNINAQINVLCVGNSITWGVLLSDRENDSYPSQLASLLGGDFYVINRGSPGHTLLRNTDLPYMESEQFYYSIATHHDIVIILLGTNDSDEDNWDAKEDFKDDYYALINSYKNFPNYDDPIYILGLPPPVFDESAGHRNAPILNEIIPMVKQIAGETGSTVADFYNALDGKPELFIDGVHTNAVGAQIMAEVAYDAIQKALSTTNIPYNHPPNTPTGLKTIPDEFNINLEWHSNTEDDLWSYRIYRSNENGGIQNYIGAVIKPNATLPPDTTFSDNNVIKNHIYYYSIAASDDHNNTSSRTAPVAGKTIDNDPPSAPTNLVASLEADSVKLSWSPNTELDIEKYHIYRNTVLNDIQYSSSLVGTAHAPDSNFIDIRYDTATNYYYGATAIDISGNEGLISNIENITTKSRPVSSDTTLIFHDSAPHSFNSSDFPFFDADNDSLDKIIFIDTNHFEYFSYNENNFDSTFTCDDISRLILATDLGELGLNYVEFSFKVIDSFGSTSLDTNTAIIHLNDKPANFNIIVPTNDSTLVIKKSNYLKTFSISWEASSDSINNGILYSVIFNDNLSELSRHGLNTTNTEYILKEILSATDTVSITSGIFSVIATDGNLETEALNSGIKLNIDGRSFAPSSLHLDQNYPNPFNSTTVIGFDLPKSADISIIIYDLLGEEVIRLINNKKYERGYNTITWNGLDKNNNLITAGIYIMQVRMGPQEKHKKLIFLK